MNQEPEPHYRSERRNFERQRPIKKKHHIFRWIIITIAVILLGAAGYEYYKIHDATEGVFGNSAQVSPKLKQGKPVSILLMGTDTGALGRTDKVGNTDTLELITINPKTKKTTLTSIPRDTLVKVNTNDGVDYVKINAAYSLGGASLTKKTVANLLNVNIDYYAIVNMGVLEKIVNAVGGVNVNNPFAFTYEGAHFPKGKQHLNGALALKYSRMRYDDPHNDYGRQKRQQQIMESVIDKVKSKPSVSAINTILDAAKQGVRTNIPVNNVAVFYANYTGALKNVNTDHFQGKNATIDGVSYQVASPKEMNRVSKTVRKELGKSYEPFDNPEKRLYKMQTTYNGYNHINFSLPTSSSD